MAKNTYAGLFSEGTAQSQPLTSSESRQVQNSAGGFVYSLSPFARLQRFLILGSDSNTYYASAQKLTVENAACVNECWADDPYATGMAIAIVSKSGRAASNSPAIFALALGVIHPDENARKNAFARLNEVCRTSTHLFEFVDTATKLGKGWGRGMVNAVAGWYNGRTDEQLAYQIIKYRSRHNFDHERLLRLSHPGRYGTHKPSLARRAMYDWLRGRETNLDLPPLLAAHIEAMKSEDVYHLCDLVTNFNLPWEALPTFANAEKEIWQVMLPSMGLTALMRNLGNMTRLGALSTARDIDVVTSRLTSPYEIQKARLHPYNILVALKTYESGRGFRGTNNWTPIRAVAGALEAAFHASFQTLVPTGKRIMLALDVSGSMDYTFNNGNMTVREASSAMALTTLNSEENASIYGFTSLGGHNWRQGGISQLAIHRGMPLERVTSYTRGLAFGGTDCALPMLKALEDGLKVDAFVIYTDSETWAGRIHPSEALKLYRERTGINAKLVVVGMTATNFTIADPYDPGMLDVVGFDSAAPSLIADFIRGSGEASASTTAQLENETTATLDNEDNAE